MASSDIVGKLRGYWQKRVIRITVALLVLGAAIYLQYRLANIPLPVDVEKGKPPYTPANAALVKKEELVVEQPVADTSDGQIAKDVLLAGDGTEYVALEARFDSAQITKAFIDVLRTNPNETSFPKQDAQQIVYSARTDEPEPDATDNSTEKQIAAPCRTAVNVKLRDPAHPPAELHFFQLTPGSEKHRTFEMRVVGSDVTVELLTRNFPKDRGDESLGHMQGSDCGKSLSIGNWNRSFTAPVPIAVVVPDGQSFRFSFTSAEGKSTWSGTGKFYEPFKLVALPINVRAIKAVKRDAGNEPAIVEARVENGKPPLVLKYFRVGSEDLQLDYAGHAMVQEDGKYAVTFSLVDFIKGNPILAGILAMLDAALLEWIRRTLFKGQQT